VADRKQELTDELEAVRAELEGLKREKKALAGELETRGAAVIELERTVAAKDSELAVLKQAVAGSEEKLTGVNDTLAQAVASYMDLVVAANPGVLPEMVTGDTIDAVNESLENARALVDRVKQGMEEEASRTRVPSGAPTRTPPDLSVLSPREKIQYAIGGKG
jgi:chromosome segregation ATPase